MRWTEIDLTGKTWTIPRERVKTDKAHEVPLSAPALSVLDVLPRIAGCRLCLHHHRPNARQRLFKGQGRARRPHAGNPQGRRRTRWAAALAAA